MCSTPGELDLTTGLVGDTWNMRGSSRTDDGSPHPDMQINVMNSRVIAMIAGEKTRWGLAGDQLYVDLDISAANVPPGTQLVDRLSRHRGHRAAAHRLRQVRPAVRRGCHEVRELASGTRAAPARRQRARCRPRPDSDRRSRQKLLPRG